MRKKDELKKKLLSNKDDLIKGTFCYSLFEERAFDIHLIETLMLSIINIVIMALRV